MEREELLVISSPASVLPVKLYLLLASKLSRHLVVWPANHPVLHQAVNRYNSITEQTFIHNEQSRNLPQFIFTTCLLLELIHTEYLRNTNQTLNHC